MKTNKHKVLLITEGTYPFNGGGVSTWAHMLCNEIKNASFSLYSINADFESQPKYTLGKNIDEIIQVPLWSPLEPQEIFDYGGDYCLTVIRKEKNIDYKIENKFIPLFKELLFQIYSSQRNVKVLDSTIKSMWEYFQKNDYKKTMQSEIVWKTFCTTIGELDDEIGDQRAKLVDLTSAMRWMYRFLIPLSIDVPYADISHLTISGFPVIPALILKYKYGTPMIVTEHGVFIRERLLAINSSEFSYFLKKMLILFSERITELVYFNADKILSVNEFNKKWEILYGADANKIEVIYNGICPDEFSPKPKPNHLKDIPTVVAAARIFELKDITTMIKSCAVVKEVIPNVKYLIYGDKNAVPEYTKECEELIKELKLEDNFILAGYHNKPSELFCEGDISILTSISEGFPYTVIESMSCGIPVVSTDVGGVTEALNDSCGRICKPKDHVDIGNKVIELLLNPELRTRMGENARKRVMDNFTIDNFVMAYERVYNETIKKEVQVATLPKLNSLQVEYAAVKAS